MALRSSALTTVAAVKADISSASGLEARVNVAAADARIERLIEAASEDIRNFCNRNFEKVEDRAELIETARGRFIRVKHAPIESVEKIEWISRSDDSVVRELEGWHVYADGKAGLIFRSTPFSSLTVEPWSTYPALSSFVLSPRLRVTYTGGFVTPVQAAAETDPPVRSLPFTIEETCIREVVTRFWGRNRNREIETQTVGDTTTTYRERRGLLPTSEASLQNFWLALL